MVKGSLTVFFAMILTGVMTLILVMNECIRIYELQDFAQDYTDMAIESAFSEYNPYLWTNYKILAVDLGYGSDTVGPSIMEQKTMDYCNYNSNVDSGFNFARLSCAGCQVKKYALLTDAKAAGVVTMGVKAAKDGMAAQVVDTIQGKVNSINNVEKIGVVEKATTGKASLKEAKEANARAKAAAAEDDDPNTNPGDYPDPGEVEDNPLDAFDILESSFSKSVLSTVTDVEKVSEKEASLESLPSHRKINVGNMDISDGNSLVDKALFIDYLMTNYEYFSHGLGHDGLKYEIEYLIAGKDTDAKNLATVVEEIMLLREAANFITITSNPSMQAEAAKIGAILAGFTMNDVIIEAVKYAIIAAWAYAESTLDLRLLLSGGHVALIKNLDQWTSDVWHLSSVANINYKAKDCKVGLSYKEFLMSFLAVNQNSTLAIRSLDVMENALNTTDDYADVKVDNMLWASEMELSFSASEMFLSVFSGDKSKSDTGDYTITKTKYISY